MYKDPFIFWVFQEICCGRETSNGNKATHNVNNVKFKGYYYLTTYKIFKPPLFRSVLK